MKLSVNMLPHFLFFTFVTAQGNSNPSAVGLPNVLGGKDGIPKSVQDDYKNIPSIMNPTQPVNSAEAMASTGTGRIHQP
jgi:hypothetical protein